MERRKRSGRWSGGEVKLLKRIYRNMSNRKVAAQLGRSISSVGAKASALGLRKTKKYLKSIGRV